MLSTFPAMSTAEGIFGIPFPPFEGGFTPWDNTPCSSFNDFLHHEPVFSPTHPQEPVMSNSGSDNSNHNHLIPSPGSDNPNQNTPNYGSGSDEPGRNRPVCVVDERKRRRMISNRESARRSRMRKQKHLENLRNQVNRLRIANRELTNWVRLATHNFQIVERDNDRLRSESVMLRRKLWDIRQVLLVRQLQQYSSSAWPCNTGMTPIMEEQNNPPSLIT